MLSFYKKQSYFSRIVSKQKAKITDIFLWKIPNMYNNIILGFSFSLWIWFQVIQRIEHLYQTRQAFNYYEVSTKASQGSKETLQNISPITFARGTRQKLFFWDFSIAE